MSRLCRPCMAAWGKVGALRLTVRPIISSPARYYSILRATWTAYLLPNLTLLDSIFPPEQSSQPIRAKVAALSCGASGVPENRGNAKSLYDSVAQSSVVMPVQVRSNLVERTHRVPPDGGWVSTTLNSTSGT
jgi:hypothetical protein